MKISFIIPQYNKPAHMLRECISSILALSLTDEEREIIVVDDGSAMPFDEALTGFESKIRLVRQHNQGLSAARNTGLSIATGEYIQFVDSDDYLLTGAYENILSHVRQHRMDMLMFYFSTKENEDINKQAVLSGACSGAEFLCNNNLRAAAWSYIFRRDILGNLRFCPGIYHEDALFTPQLILQAKRLHTIKQESYFYRQHGGTIMSTRSREHITKRLDDSLFILRELSGKAEQLSGQAREGMDRCIHQQVMGYIYFLFVLKCSVGEIRRRVNDLRRCRLFPMPLKFYTLKYYLFALLSRCIY